MARGICGRDGSLAILRGALAAAFNITLRASAARQLVAARDLRRHDRYHVVDSECDSELYGQSDYESDYDEQR